MRTKKEVGAGEREAVMRFRRLPTEVEAIQWTGENFDDLWEWGVGSGGLGDNKIFQQGVGWEGREDKVHPADRNAVIHTLEGELIARPGDWIIKGIEGEFYPCKPAIFAKTYEPLPGTSQLGSGGGAL